MPHVFGSAAGSATSTSTEPLRIIPALADFYRRYPDIQLDLGVSDRPVDLIGENVDCVLRGGELLEQSLVARRVANVRLVAVASPAINRNSVLFPAPFDPIRHTMLPAAISRSTSHNTCTSP